MNYFREQILTLPQLIDDVIEPFAHEAARVFDDASCQSLTRLHTIGCGDSYFAALATEFAFESIAGVPTEPQTAMTFSRYSVVGQAVSLPPANLTQNGQADSLPYPTVIGISVSGGVTRTIEGVLRAKQRGLRTVAVTSSDATPIAKAADAVLITKAPDVPNADGVLVPGARSYFASLVMLYSVALRLAEGRLPPSVGGRHDVRAWRAQLAATADAVRQTIEMSDAAAKQLAEDTLDAKGFVFCGSGPNFATAQFCAAKMLEATGDSAIGQDVEEWAHLQYFAKTANTPTFLISAGERDASRAAEVQTAMQAVGRRVVEVGAHGSAPLPYASTPEAFAPLVACIPTMLFASYRAELLDEPYFRAFGGGRSIQDGGGISRIRTSEMVVE